MEGPEGQERHLKVVVHDKSGPREAGGRVGSVVLLSSAHCLDQQPQQGAAEGQKGPSIT